MEQQPSYTIEEIAGKLRVSKLTVYDLIKKGELSAYRVGRQMRVDADDLNRYKKRTKVEQISKENDYEKRGETTTVELKNHEEKNVMPTNDMLESKSDQAGMSYYAGKQQFIVSGQDIVLDLLATRVEKEIPGVRTLRSHQGSLNGLVSLYRGEVDLASTHLFDGDSGTYNLPYIKKLLTGRPFLVVHVMKRQAGFYVAKGNPYHIQKWSDLIQPALRFVNREAGSGIRVLVDEQMRLATISPSMLQGYHTCVENSHVAVATAIAAGKADVGVGIEKAAKLLEVEFIPLMTEQYDLVMMDTHENRQLIETILTLLQGEEFRREISSIGGYDVSMCGEVLDRGFW
ncbi:substrate-binding domain-containing protein [Brevibacillus daliensis]|uniref:substrate-binding domain-containing protein n=1 Tax=Brevibacillus daliensis TaxID=2892995 RepID=UPI001E34F529|nr:substrate-binding domain-containing protein [Brevibacillus daliensis]